MLMKQDVNNDVTKASPIVSFRTRAPAQLNLHTGFSGGFQQSSTGLSLTRVNNFSCQQLSSSFQNFDCAKC